MKLKLNKEELVTLSDDAEELGLEVTPQVGGAGVNSRMTCETWEWNCRLTIPRCGGKTKVGTACQTTWDPQ